MMNSKLVNGTKSIEATSQGPVIVMVCFDSETKIASEMTLTPAQWKAHKHCLLSAGWT